MQLAIKEIRKSQGLSQEELSKLSGISRQTIGRLESNKETVVTTKTLERLANVLSCTVPDFFVQ